MNRPATGLTRRQAIVTTALAGMAGVQILRNPALAASLRPDPAPLFKISLAQWSLHRALHGGKLEHFDFPKVAKEEYGIDAVEYVNGFFKKKNDEQYNKDLRKRCDDIGVKSVLIMCDGEGNLGDPDEKKRIEAVENHRKWLDAAKILGCHSIRVNASSSGTRVEQVKLASDGLSRLCTLAEPYALGVIVENHGGLSSHGDWLSTVMRKVAKKNVGTLPDFGNFYEYDRYEGVKDLMPFAKGVSAKSHEFNEQGDEVRTDYRKMLKIVLDAGYHGYIGIEYEGDKHSEPDGIKLTKKLLEKVRTEMSAEMTPKPASAPKGS